MYDVFPSPLLRSSLLLLCFCHAALKAIHTSTAEVLRLLTCIDRVAVAADFHRLLFHRAWDHKDAAAG